MKYRDIWLEVTHLIKSIEINIVDKSPQLLGDIKWVKILLRGLGRCRMLPETHSNIIQRRHTWNTKNHANYGTRPDRHAYMSIIVIITIILNYENYIGCSLPIGY